MNAIESMPTPKRIRPRASRRPLRVDTAHWAKPWEVQIRAARSEEGRALKALVDEATQGYGWQLPDCDWSRVAPFWYVAHIEGYLLGAVQICVGYPIGRMELLSIRRGLSKTKRAKVVKALVSYVATVMAHDGFPMIGTTIPEQDAQFLKIVMRYGARPSIKGRQVYYPCGSATRRPQEE